MSQIIREGMDDYWRVVHSETDKGLDATELKWKREWKREWERDMDRWADKWDKVFSK